MRVERWLLCALVTAGVAACSGEARLNVADGMGPDPELPPPEKELIPTLKIAWRSTSRAHCLWLMMWATSSGA